MCRLPSLVICISLYCCPSLAQQEERLLSDLFSLANARAQETLRVVPPPTKNGAVMVDLSYRNVAINRCGAVDGYISMSMIEHTCISRTDCVVVTDGRLQWNASEYGDRHVLKVPSSYIWLPDIRVVSSRADEQSNDSPLGELVVITSDGEVSFLSKRTFNLQCLLNLTDFPSDIRTCELALGPWVHFVDELKLNLPEMRDDLADINNNSAWTVMNMNLSSNITMYASGTYQTVTLKVTLRRRPEFHLQLLVAPLEVVSFVLPLIHLLPSGCSQKSVLGGLLLVCSLLLHRELYLQLGGFAGSDAPTIVQRYRIQMIVIVVSIGISSLTAAIANTAHTLVRVPYIIRKVTSWLLARICCCNLGGGSENTSPGSVSYNAKAGVVAMTTDDISDGNQNPSQDSVVDELKLSRERRQLEIEWNQLALLVDRVAVVTFVVYAIVAAKLAPKYEM